MNFSMAMKKRIGSESEEDLNARFLKTLTSISNLCSICIFIVGLLSLTLICVQMLAH